MARLRLFAQAREAAGTGRVEVAEGTVDTILRSAEAAYGEEIAAIVAASQVWVNGHPAVGSTRVGSTDEVAILPPVSGG
ncbi:MAG: MoaD/ThiS family protein [Acidimicrobiia bacterium]|nr:MoaD/ThiS family protein [Acidimicrobiia bacterium]